MAARGTKVKRRHSSTIRRVLWMETSKNERGEREWGRKREKLEKRDKLTPSLNKGKIYPILTNSFFSLFSFLGHWGREDMFV